MSAQEGEANLIDLWLGRASVRRNFGGTCAGPLTEYAVHVSPDCPHALCWQPAPCFIHSLPSSLGRLFRGDGIALDHRFCITLAGTALDGITLAGSYGNGTASHSHHDRRHLPLKP